MDESDSDRPPSPAKLSRTPSWVMLGFLLGVLFVLALRKEEERAIVPTLTAAPTVVKLERPKVTEIEAVFTDWGQYAKWRNDVTEVALWDTAKHSFTIYYEVLRNGDAYYFRSIPKLTRPLVPGGLPSDCPLLFTQPEETRRETSEAGDAEYNSRGG